MFHELSRVNDGLDMYICLSIRSLSATSTRLLRRLSVKITMCVMAGRREKPNRTLSYAVRSPDSMLFAFAFVSVRRGSSRELPCLGGYGSNGFSFLTIIEDLHTVHRIYDGESRILCEITFPGNHLPGQNTHTFVPGFKTVRRPDTPPTGRTRRRAPAANTAKGLVSDVGLNSPTTPPPGAKAKHTGYTLGAETNDTSFKQEERPSSQPKENALKNTSHSAYNATCP